MKSEPVQPSAAPALDVELQQLIDMKRQQCRQWNVSVQGYGELQELIREGEFLETVLVEVARLRALQESKT